MDRRSRCVVECSACVLAECARLFHLQPYEDLEEARETAEFFADCVAKTELPQTIWILL